MTEKAAWPGPITAITIFADDLAAAKQFYLDVFDLPISWQDDVSAVFTFGGTMINLLQVSEAPELIAPALVAPVAAGNRIQFTLTVDDVDATCAVLAEHGVSLLNGPIDRPWGIRTATFVDPTGQIWEIAS